jgi:hypothetical protein
MIKQSSNKLTFSCMNSIYNYHYVAIYYQIINQDYLSTTTFDSWTIPK